MLTTANRKWREARMVARGLQSSRHPVLAQESSRFGAANTPCAYCNEFDNHSSPVPLDTMLERIDHLARLGTTTVNITSSGEPYCIQAPRHHHPPHPVAGALAGLITNGYLLTGSEMNA